MMSRSPLLLAAAALLLALPARSDAAFFVETGDAGALPSAAQTVTGVSNLTGIQGNLSSTGDRDMFRIFLTGGRTFSATTVGQPGTLLDTQLFLFDSTGRGVYANDDDAAGQGANAYRSTLPSGTSLTPMASGIYYLLIVASGAYPTSSAGLIFPNFSTAPIVDPTAVVGPTGPGGSSPITGYTGAATEFGTYQIALTGATSVVPEPASALLVGCGVALAGLAAARRRRDRVGQAAA